MPTSFPVATLAALGLTSPLLSSCLPVAPETTSAPSGAPAAAAAGMPGHHFGEPLRDFPHLVLVTTADAQGERVRVRYSEKLTSPLQCWLEVPSKLLVAVRQAKQHAWFQAENTLGKPQVL